MVKRPESIDRDPGPSPERGREAESSQWLRQAGLLTAIPFVLLVGPAIGYYVGTAVDRRWQCAPWGMTVGIILGLAASGRTVAQLIRQSQDFDHDT